MAEDLATPSNTLVKVRWKEPYVSEGLNKKLNGLIPSGVIRGGRLTTSLLASHVTVAADPETNDSIYSFIDANGHQLTFRQQADVSLDLDIGTLPGTTAYIGLEIVYTTSAATSVKWRGFTAAEVAADPTLVILGSVVVPAVAAIIPTTDILYDVRKDAGFNLSAGMRDWRQVVKNSSFEGRAISVSDTTQAEQREFAYWEFINGPNGNWRVLSPGSGPASQPHTGDNNLIANGAGAGLHVMTAEPLGAFRVTPGQTVKTSVWVRGDSVNLVSGASAIVGISIAAYEWNGTDVSDPAPWNSGTIYFTEDGTVVNGTFDYFEISGSFKVPANAAFIRAQLIVSESTQFDGDIGFDDFQIWLEPGRVHLPDDRRVDLYEPEIVTPGIAVIPRLNQDGIGENPSSLMQRALRLLCSDANTASLEHEWRMISDSVVSWVMAMPQGKLHIGSELAGSAFNAATRERLKTWFYNVDGHYTLQWEMDGDGGVSTRGKIRIYAAHGAGVSGNQMALCITHNAAWDSTLNAGAGGWVRDVFGSSYRFDFGQGDLYYYGYSQTDPDGWPDTDWDSPGLECLNLDTNLSAGEADLYLPGGTDDCNYRFRSPRYGNYLYFNGSALLPTTNGTVPLSPDWARLFNTEAYPKVSGGGSALMLDLGAHLKDGDYIEDMWIWSEFASGTQFSWELREIEFHDPAAAPTDSLIDSGNLTTGVGHHLDKATPGYFVDKGWGTNMIIPYLLIWPPLTLGALNSIHAVAFRYDTQRTYV